MEGRGTDPISMRGRGQARCMALFTILLLVAMSAPVLAAEPSEVPQAEPPGFTALTPEEEEIAATQVPDAHDVSKALGEAEHEEVEREEWLASPAAKQQREASRFAFGNLAASESEELLRSVFGEQLEALNTDPSRFLSDAQLVRPLGDSGAVVKDEGESSLLETTVPVRTEDEEGQLAKVNLSLEATPEGFQTENAISDLVLPSAADEAIQVGEEGFEIAQGGAAASSANRFGDKNLFYPSVLPDTDLLVAGNSFGAELFDLLRSKDSPEDLRFDIGLPEGAELRSDERGGAEVVRAGERLTLIPKPYALDAQGAEIPVQMEVEGGSVVVHVAHREGDYAYPALLDPIVEDWVNQGSNWYGGNNWAALSNGAWKFTRNNSNVGTEGGEICCWEVSHAGLLINMRAAFYGPEQFGQWAYSTANSKVYITHAWLIPFNRADMGCGSAQPHDYVGLWNPGDVWSPIWLNYAKNNGNLAGDGVGQSLVIGEGSGPPGVWLACNRILYAGGVGIWLNDDWGPIISVTGVPSQWFSDTDHLNVDITSGDEGLGVHHVSINNDGQPIVPDNVGFCTGLYGNRCPNDHISHFEITGDSFGEGIRTSGVTAEDPTGKTAGTQFTTRVDRTPPEVTLNGQLAAATEEEKGDSQDPEKWDELSLPTYNLKIEATDGSLTSNLTKRSGVKNIEVFLDGKKMEVPWSALTSCPETSCARTQTYALKLTGLTLGKHTLEVKAVDFVGKVRERNIEFEYIPATGMKDEYVMQHFPLPDGQGDEADEEHPARPELAVNVMNGNLVYRQRDIDVQGAAVSLEVERFYNSQLPDSENTEWGDGWTLAETPDLEPFKSEGSPVPDKADLVSNGGALASRVNLPTTAGSQTFDPALQSTLTKKSNGGYELADESGQSSTSVSFSEAGRTEARLTEGPAKVDYSYGGGGLAEIAVKDPGSTSMDPEELQEAGTGPKEPTYASSFGAFGSGDGQLKSPGDVAVDSQGNLWVADTSNSRIQELSPQGQFLAKFGSSGSGDGQLNRPTSIAIASNGDLLVTDAGNARVERFSSAGAYLSKFGAKGSGNGQFAGSGPEGIAIDSSGNIWVSDTYGGRLEEFSSTGAFVKVVASKGSGSGQLGEPAAIAMDAGGNLWVADRQNNRLSVFSGAGGFLSQVGSAGSGNGQFSSPSAIDIDGQGHVWVADRGNNRIEQFDVAGQYAGQFGSPGSAAGQFSFASPMGLATDPSGHIWIADTGNNRVQKWLAPGAPVLFASFLSSFGSYGSGSGQLKSPSDVALDSQGDVWVLDRGNNRVQQFSPQGDVISQFGTYGTGNGQLNAPSSIALDEEGNLWVTDTGNNRVEKFNEKGEYLSKFGSLGSGNGQFKEPVGIAIAQGTAPVFVVDRGNSRVERFTKAGAYYGQKGSYGSAPSQLIEPSAIALGGPSGESTYTVLIADSGNDRVQRWTPAGAYVSQFGSHGAGAGQLERPEAIDVDGQGDAWVGDRGNGRVQVFDESGKYLDQLGAKGSGPGQFSFAYSMGIAVGSEGGVWVTDTADNRIESWFGFRSTSSGVGPLIEDDPRVEVHQAGGEVSSVVGEEAGEHSYEHKGDDLTAHEGPEGETKYSYDAAGRMTKVTLPNGTWGEIAYQADGRVKAVTVDPAGSPPAKKTEFEYSDEPRRTVVVPPDAPHVTYDIGPDGSVLRWWNTLQPPQFDDIAGTIYDNRGKELWPGDHNLSIQAHSEEGIASIDVVANGNQLVDERTCAQTEAPGLECLTEVDEWVLSTDEYPPGRLNLEVIITDRLGYSAAERFWVNIPPPPPPLAPGTPVPPRFHDIAKFREEFGLDVVDPVANEIELNERIFNLIKAWYEPNTPEGQVARATMERWGVPLRPRDVAELEYRQRYVEQAGKLIPAWASSHAPSTYAGYYVDHRAGGVIHVGFTQNQASNLEALKAAGFIAPDRLAGFSAPPQHAYGDLVSAQLEVAAHTASLPSFTQAPIDVQGNILKVGTTGSVSSMSNALNSLLGANAPVSAYFDPNPIPADAAREGRLGGRVQAGDRIENKHAEECTANFGAWLGQQVAGSTVYKHFLLTAGHCGQLGEEFRRGKYDPSSERFEYQTLGKAHRQGIEGDGQVDALAILLQGEADAWAPKAVYLSPGETQPITGSALPTPGMLVCTSGSTTNRVLCGQVEGPPVPIEYEGYARLAPYEVPVSIAEQHGDSGGPVWQSGTGNAVGLWNAGINPSFVAPLLPYPVEVSSNYGGVNFSSGALAKLGFDPEHLSVTP
jgi:tripartite motif-containing protein 71